MNQPKPGIYNANQYPNDKYHAAEAVSKSKLDKISRSPLHYLTSVENPEEQTDAMRLGTAVHLAVLEPHEFALRYLPEFDPDKYPYALRSVADIQNALVEYNNGLGAYTSDAELVDYIEAYNAESIPTPIKKGRNDDMLKALVDAGVHPDGMDEMKAGELRALVDEYNKGLPAPVPAGGAREQLVANIATFDQPAAASFASETVPVRFKKTDTKADLTKLLLAANPEAQVLDHIKDEYYKGTGRMELLTGPQYEQMIGMRDAVHDHPAAGAILEQGQPEVSFVADLAEHPEGFEPRIGLGQCRADWWREEMDIFADLKTTEDARPEAFSRACYNFRYHVAAAYYSDIYKLCTGRTLRGFYFIAVEKKPPYAVAVYKASDSMVELGRQEYLRDLRVYQDCKVSGVWPGYPEEITALNLPGWVMKRAS